MRRSGFVVVGMWLALTLGSGCGGGGGGGGGGVTGIASLLQGTWAQCEDTGSGTSYKIAITFSGSNVSAVLSSHAGGACAGAGTTVDSVSGTFAIGTTVTANLGATPVTAYQINYTVGGSTFYDLIHVDTSATPDRYYEGDSSGANDGSTPALRPVVLDDSYFYVKQ